MPLLASIGAARGGLLSSDQKSQAEWLEGVAQAVLVCDQHGYIVEGNALASQLFGQNQKALSSLKLTDLAMLDPGWLEPRADGGQMHVIQGERRLPPKPPHRLEFCAQPLTLEGKPGWLITVHDLSAVNRLEEMVRRINALKDEIVAHMAVGLMLTDRNGCLAHVSPQAADMLGYPIEALLGEPWTILEPNPLPVWSLQGSSGEAQRIECQLRRGDGQWLDVLISRLPYLEGEQPAGDLIFVSDISGQRRAERGLKQRNQALERAMVRLQGFNQAAMQAIRRQDRASILQAVSEQLAGMGLSSLVAEAVEDGEVWHVLHIDLGHKAPRNHGPRVEHLPWEVSFGRQDELGWELTQGGVIWLDRRRASEEKLAPLLRAVVPIEDCGRYFVPLPDEHGPRRLLAVWGYGLHCDDLPSVQAFAGLLAMTLQTADLLQAHMRHTKLARWMADLAAASGQPYRGHLLDAAADVMLNASGMRACRIYLWDSSRSDYGLACHRPEREALSRWLESQTGHDVIRPDPEVKQVLEAGTPVWRADGGGQPEAARPGDRQLWVPVSSDGQCLGMAILSGPPAGLQFPDDAMNFLRAASEQLAIGLQKMKFQAEQERQTAIELEVNAIVRRTLSTLELDQVIDETLAGIGRIFGCSQVALLGIKPGASQWMLIGSLGRWPPDLEAKRGCQLAEWPLGDRVISGEPVWVANLADLEAPGRLEQAMLSCGMSTMLVAGLRDGSCTSGALLVASPQVSAFNPYHQTLACRFADQLAIALANAGHFRAAQTRAGELEALHQLALDLSGETDLDGLMRRALAQIVLLTGAQAGAIYLLSEDGMQLVCRAQSRESDLWPQGLGKGHAALGRLWRGVEWVAGGRSADLRGADGEPSIWAAVPLMWREDLRGAIVLDAPRGKSGFGEDDLDLVRRVAAFVCVGIENLHQRSELLHRTDLLKRVNDLGRRITAILDISALKSEIVQRIARRFEIDRVSLYTFRSGVLIQDATYDRKLDCLVRGLPTKGELAAPQLAVQAAETGRIIHDAVLEESGRASPPVYPHAIALPLKSKGEVIGVLVAERSREGPIGEADTTALQALGAHISTALVNAELHAEAQRVQAQVAEAEKMRAVGLMTSGIAHDFKNSLAVILARAELALMKTNAPEVRKDLEQIVASARAAGESVSRMQDYARTRSSTAQPQPFSLRDLILETLEICRPRWSSQARGEGIAISVETDIDDDACVVGIRGELREALINLLFNAIEAMPEGGTIRVRSSSQGSEALLEVADTGIGISEDVRSKLFVPFYTTKENGTGLGLAMVSGAVHRHAGRIELESEPGKGTCFRIWLPLALASQVADQSEKELISDMRPSNQQGGHPA
jgi:PAS domain S-box-containing protein